MGTTTILQPGEIEAAAHDIPELRLPGDGLFLDRAWRFRQLAEGHALADWLNFLALLSEAQHGALASLDSLVRPDDTLLDRCRDHAMPPLAPPTWARDPAWRTVLGQLAESVRSAAPETLKVALDRLEGAHGAWLEDQADRVLAGSTEGLDLALAPLIGAALQTCWTRLAMGLEIPRIARPAYPNLCPVCGSHPVSSVVRIGGSENGLRFLHCSLCSSEWHVVRSKCSNCDNSRGVAYFAVEGQEPAISAETCPECQTYLKVLRQDKNPHVDPVADDLASLALDILVGEEGFSPSGINLLMIAPQA